MPSSLEPGAPDLQQSAPKLTHVLLIALLAVWLSWPALLAVPIEAFSTRLEMISLLLARHHHDGLLLADQAFPLVTEFLFMTRSGLIDALTVLAHLTGHTGDPCFRILTVASLVVYLAAATSMAKRWASESQAYALLALVLTPGIIESSFTLADNLPSAALGIAALSLLGRENTSLKRWVGIGTLFALSMLIRLDAMLLAPAFFIGLLLNHPKPTLVCKRMLAFALPIVAVFSLAQIFTPFHLRESLLVGGFFAKIHTEANDKVFYRTGVGFFGLITPFLLALGAKVNVQRQRWSWTLCILVLPALFYLFCLLRAPEIRNYFLLGAPALAIVGASGIRTWLESWHSTGFLHRAVSYGITFVALVAFLGPTKIALLDGPRSPMGRIYSPLVWRQWQQSTNQGMQRMDTLIEGLGAGETLLAISTHYNPDTYFRFRLLEAGYDIVPASATGFPCPTLPLELYRKGDRTVIHVRSELPYMLPKLERGLPMDYAAAYQLNLEFQCLHNARYTSAALVSFGGVDPIYLIALPGNPSESPRWRSLLPQSRLIPSIHRVFYPEIAIVPMNQEQIDLLQRNVEIVSRQQAASALGWRPLTSYDTLRKLYTWQSAH
ncbi:MAG: glycosyltransferase family 39 protein [Acidobacteriaceae bacterium]|nr:glycosyltransferase family 39 protein [Acidobacteriaceae bacterium]